MRSSTNASEAFTRTLVWRFVGSGTAAKPLYVGDVDVWKHEWQRVSDVTATVVDPVHRQEFQFDVYRIQVERVIEFAAGEFSPGVWGFYQETRSGVARYLWCGGLGAVLGALLGLIVASSCGAHVGYGMLFGAIVGFLVALVVAMAGLALLEWLPWWWPS